MLDCAHITDVGLASIAAITTLEKFYFGTETRARQIRDESLASLGNLVSLKELEFAELPRDN